MRRLFEEGALASIPIGSGRSSVEVERRLKSWSSKMDLAERMEMATSFSSSSLARASAHSQGMEARSKNGFFRPGRGLDAHVVFL